MDFFEWKTIGDPQVRKHDEPATKRNRPSTILTVECPGCRRSWLLPRDKWPSKKSGEPLGCAGCGTYVPTREWALLDVEWLRVVEAC